VTSERTYLIVWPDEPTPLPDPGEIAALTTASQVHGGELLALGPVEDVVETAAGPAPAWAAVAMFDDSDSASRFFQEHRASFLPGVAILVPGLAERVWWPIQLADKRPEWSQRGEIPAERLGLLVSVWLDVHDIESQIDYAQHFKWTIEAHDGAALATQPLPVLLAGDGGPLAMGLFAWPSREEALAWYECDDYLPYRAQRHAASDTTVISIPRLPGVGHGTARSRDAVDNTGQSEPDAQ
jgi:uncharacterized protein (DUF1330 family)